MRRFEYMHFWVKGAHGGYDATPSPDAVVAKLNELGAAGWQPIPTGGGGIFILMRETTADVKQPSRPMPNLVAGSKPVSEQ